MPETITPGETDIGSTEARPAEIEGQYDDVENRQPAYERRSFYPAAHSVMRMLRRHQEELADANDQPQLNRDQVDAMLLDVMALADEHLINPSNLPAVEQQRKRIAEFGLLQDKSGDELTDAFLSELGQEKQDVSTEEPTGNEVDKEIEGNIIRLLSHPQVREEFVKVFSQETSLRKDAKTPITDLITLENAIDAARARYRQIQNEPRNLDPQSASVPTGVIDRNLGKYLEIIENLEQRIKTKEARLGVRESGLLESYRLLKTRHQMREFGFALTKSRQALFDRISELTSAGYKIFLGGPTGTGKTSLAVFAMRQIVGEENNFEVVSWSSETTTRDLFGKPIIKANTEGKIESTMQKGPYARVLSGETSGIVSDEVTSGQTASLLSLKRIWQAHPGEGINLPGFNGQVFTKDNFHEIATGNLRSKQHQQREEMDPAIAREFVSISVPFMDSDEAKQVLLSSFMHESGFLPLSKNDVEMLDQLCRAAEFTQKAFAGKFSAEELQSDFYRNKINPGGVEVHLTKTFFDSGTLFRLVSGVSGRSFAEHLRVNLSREINENPHLEALSQEKDVFKKILKAYGFDVDAGEDESFYRPISGEVANEPASSKPYILPSEMGFLSHIEKIDVDEFEEVEDGQPESVPKHRVDREIDDMMADPNIPDSVKAALSGEKTPLSGEILEQMKIAREILDQDLTDEEKAKGITNFIGPDHIKSAFLDKVEISEIPPILFSRKTLERARELGQYLRFQAIENKDGKPITMLEIHDMLNEALASEGKGKILASRDDEWKLKSDFYTKEAPKYGWILTSKECIPGSLEKDYLEQTQALADYLRNEVFKDETMLVEYAEAIAEFDKEKADIAKIVKSSDEAEWKEAARRLEALKLNQLTRQSPVESLYGDITYFQTTGERLMEDKYDCTNRRDSDGRLVYVGYFESGGVSVSGDGPGRVYPALGVSFSRSQ
ncbi:MAG: AAA family ATPase [Candidatus Berkelbacteria bacterium]|nr:AAA family ATPase [Candidatus Berkelbacteria bacterium]